LKEFDSVTLEGRYKYYVAEQQSLPDFCYWALELLLTTGEKNFPPLSVVNDVRLPVPDNFEPL
jgi:hypothetical protein